MCLLIFVMGEPLDQEMITLGDSSVPTSFYDFPECEAFCWLIYGELYSLLKIK